MAVDLQQRWLRWLKPPLLVAAVSLLLLALLVADLGGGSGDRRNGWWRWNTAGSASSRTAGSAHAVAVASRSADEAATAERDELASGPASPGLSALAPAAGPGDGSGAQGAGDGQAGSQDGDRVTEDATGAERTDPAPPADDALAGAARDPAVLADIVEAVRRDKQRLEEAQARLELREAAIRRLEQDTEQKLARLEELAAQIETLLGRVEADEEERLRSLVAVYQAMKPKQAARIFDRMELDTLLRVARRMRETKLAPIIAAMDPARAQELTAELSKPADLPALD